MKTIEIKGHIFLRNTRYGIEPNFTFFGFDASQTDPDYIKVCDHTINAEVPDDFDPREAQIASLEKQREKVRAELGRRITEINDQIAKLQALTFDPA
ncbi:hypothetical protein CIG66_07125 [Ralstonia pseudosolanacearum]|uniref:hypothetical protein n=1 Tax=Ralstonia pseudosolanacearum TaxID=1310165 RepID=UPI000B9A12C8|nr:hypothetical protein CIG66_07125 [Ralstonia pseudosolanacearum]